MIRTRVALSLLVASLAVVVVAELLHLADPVPALVPHLDALALGLALAGGGLLAVGLVIGEPSMSVRFAVVAAMVGIGVTALVWRIPGMAPLRMLIATATIAVALVALAWPIERARVSALVATLLLYVPSFVPGQPASFPLSTLVYAAGAGLAAWTLVLRIRSAPRDPGESPAA